MIVHAIIETVENNGSNLRPEYMERYHAEDKTSRRFTMPVGSSAKTHGLFCE